MTNKNEMNITWHIEDVRMCLENAERDEKLSDADCRAILERVKRNHDATIGVNWDVIEFHIDEFLREKNEPIR